MFKNKLTLLALACGLSFAANAQTSEEEVLKPTTGNKTLEVGLNLNGGTFGQLKLRKFSSEQFAFRYAVSASYDHNALPDDASSSNLTLSFAPGFEKHFSGTRRLSPYIGLTVPLSLRSVGYKSETVEVKGSQSESYISTYDRSYFGVGVDGLAGVDFYVVKNFYIGFEVGAGLAYRKYGDVEIKHKWDFASNRTVEGHHGFNFQTFTSGGLRVGFAF